MRTPLTRTAAFLFSAALVRLLAPGSALAASSDMGTSWLKIPTSANAAAMGGAYAAVAYNVDALGINPAGLAGIRSGEIVFLQSFWAQDLTLEYLAYGQSLSRNTGLALAANYMNFGSVDKILIGSNGTPVANGTYSPMALDISAGLGSLVAGGLQVGGTVKFLMQNIQTSSSATAAVDLGVLCKLSKSGFSLAAVMNNWGGTLDTDSLPLQLTLGAAFQTALGNQVFKYGKSKKFYPTHYLTLSTDGNLALGDTSLSNYRVGAEYWYNQLVALRAGYRFAPYGDLAGVRGLAFGAGLRLQRWELSYALTTQGDMGATHQISLMSRF